MHAGAEEPPGHVQPQDPRLLTPRRSSPVSPVHSLGEETQGAGLIGLRANPGPLSVQDFTKGHRNSHQGRLFGRRFHSLRFVSPRLERYQRLPQVCHALERYQRLPQFSLRLNRYAVAFPAGRSSWWLIPPLASGWRTLQGRASDAAALGLLDSTAMPSHCLLYHGLSQIDHCTPPLRLNANNKSHENPPCQVSGCLETVMLYPGGYTTFLVEE
ncbi:hypothetical protein THAOC_29068 [Thalassiosira oceanica]|uniref:Uncharacterized protein n=1 Tax=Thalassiosira oceanica TaxID=159749 RepID=K0RS66_THAOC|nr:hypothetical protein THAOC_29068 [Thalassiosira oceanica]|eukprot:EJK51736.1 hypothetical protein THAOC_29068 [Thalassiosira oceanica]